MDDLGRQIPVSRVPRAPGRRENSLDGVMGAKEAARCRRWEGLPAEGQLPPPPQPFGGSAQMSPFRAQGSQGRQGGNRPPRGQWGVGGHGSSRVRRRRRGLEGDARAQPSQ